MSEFGRFPPIALQHTCTVQRITPRRRRTAKTDPIRTFDRVSALQRTPQKLPFRAVTSTRSCREDLRSSYPGRLHCIVSCQAERRARDPVHTLVDASLVGMAIYSLSFRFLLGVPTREIQNILFR